MVDDPPLPADTGGTVRLHLVLMTPVAAERIVAAVGGDTAPWLGERIDDVAGGVRHFACDLELQVSPEGRAVFRKSAVVGLGEPVEQDDRWMVPVEWRAATLAPLFPVFAGHLTIRPDRVQLDGRYAPPGGALGFALDRALLGVAARGTGRWFLRLLAAILDPERPRSAERAS